MSTREDPQQAVSDAQLDAHLGSPIPFSQHSVGRPFLDSHLPTLAFSATDAARFLLVWSWMVVEHRSLISNHDEYESVAAKALDRLQNDENSERALFRAEIMVEELRSTASRERIVTELNVGYDRLVHHALHRTTDRREKLIQQVRILKEQTSVLEGKVESLETQLKGDISNRLDWERANRKRQRNAEKELRNVRPKLEEVQSDLRQAELTIGELKHESHALESENRALSQQIVAKRSEGRLQLLCNICVNSNEAYATKCGHIFCKNCLNDWKRLQKDNRRPFSCPQYRGIVEPVWIPLWY